MKFFQKRWVAVILCILMVAAAFAIGWEKQQDRRRAELPENADAYIGYVRDEADVLNVDTVEMLAVYNARFNRRYGSVCGIAVVESFAEKTIEDAAFNRMDDMNLGEWDFLLLLDWPTGKWFFVCGEKMEPYVNSRLEALVTDGAESFFRRPDRALAAMFESLERWYDSRVWTGSRVVRSVGPSVGGVIFFLILIPLLVCGAVFSAAFRAGRRVVHRWGPVVVPRYHRWRSHFHNNPGSGPHMGQGPADRPGSCHGSSGRGGGFGGEV